MSNRIVCLYHKNCADGRAAAWALLKAHPHAELYAMDYGDQLPGAVSDADVYLVDFSLKTEPAYEALLGLANKVTVVDHHKTAFPVLAKVAIAAGVDGNVEIVKKGKHFRIVVASEKLDVSFDTEHSGAYLTWEFFHGLKNVPAFLLQVEDRDLWKFNRAGSREMHAYLQSKDFSFEVMDEVRDWDRWQEAIDAGRVILEPHDRQVREFVEKDKGNQQVLKSHYGDLLVPVFALPCKKWYSDVTNEAVKNPNMAASGVAVAWTILPDAPDMVDYRITSNNALLSAGDIAKLYGGGGHDGAAGFKVPVADHTPGDLSTITLKV